MLMQGKTCLIPIFRVSSSFQDGGYSDIGTIRPVTVMKFTLNYNQQENTAKAPPWNGPLFMALGWGLNSFLHLIKNISARDAGTNLAL